MDKDVPIRSVHRALEILKAINRLKSPTLTEISKAVNLPYPTVFRIVQTLSHEGVIEQEHFRKKYRVTELVKSLSSGFQEEDKLVQAAQAPMFEFTAEHLWPLALTVRVGNQMMIKHATHKMTSQTFINYFPGDTAPLLDCSAGRTILAFCDDDERTTVLNGLKKRPSEQQGMGLQIVNNAQLLQEIRDAGYATMARTQFTEMPGKTSAISVPVFNNGRLVAALALIVFANAMSMEQAAERYFQPLRKLADTIGTQMQDRNEGRSP